MDRLVGQFGEALLDASGEAVGLPRGQMGNSEVGHLNLGAGRIVYQELVRISRSISEGDFFRNPALLAAMHHARDNGGRLHLVGLVSDGGVHSHVKHLHALLDMAVAEQLERVYVHAILDGRDTIPRGARPFLQDLDERARAQGSGYIATVSGRYYAMDRDKRWERVEKAYRALVRGEGLQVSSPLEALDQAYARDEGDEFVQPTVVTGSRGRPLAPVHDKDSIIFFNFRPDRVRQLSRALILDNFREFDRGRLFPRPYFVSMTEYARDLPVEAAFKQKNLKNTLGEVYATQGLSQMRIAETEKYAHVTFFFNGGREDPYPGEERILVPSPRVATYDLQPEMSAPEVTERILDVIREDRHPLIIANYANADMVGHSGSLPAAIRAVQAVDDGIGAVAHLALPRGWVLLICADHGNAEEMKSAEGERLTAHSSNPVPFLLCGPRRRTLRDKGILADIAPTVLTLAGIKPPPEMTGQSMFF